MRNSCATVATYMWYVLRLAPNLLTFVKNQKSNSVCVWTMRQTVEYYRNETNDRVEVGEHALCDSAYVSPAIWNRYDMHLYGSRGADWFRDIREFRDFPSIALTDQWSLFLSLCSSIDFFFEFLKYALQFSISNGFNEHSVWIFSYNIGIQFSFFGKRQNVDIFIPNKENIFNFGSK